MLLKTFVVLAVVALASGQRRYYSLEDMPDTNFDCRDKILGGYYADPETNCQMFHVCVKIPGQGVQDFRFLCPNETSFDQENQICADSGDIDCEASGLYLENFDLYRIGSAQAKRPVAQFGSSKGTVLPLGPSTKSPILTNNVYEDDDFYLQKSESGDRRLHSKDILRGSSSSNFFNNRNKGKDLEDDDEEAPKRTDNNQFRARQNAPAPRPKTQYQSQFRTTEAPTTVRQPQAENQNQLNDKKRTKVAVRKLARKRPSEEVPEGRPTQPPPQPSFSSFTTQVTQKYSFGDQGRYNTINRQQTTPSTVPTTEIQRQQPQQPQQPQQLPQQPQQPQQRLQNFRRPEQQTTLAFFEPSPTPRAFSEPKAEAKDTTPFSLLRNPIVAAGPNFQGNQNRGSTNYQQSRPTSAPLAQNGNFPAPTQNYQPQQNRQTTPGVTTFPQQRQNNGNFQQARQQPQANGFQGQQGSFQNQPSANFQPRQQPQVNFQNQQSNGNFQQNRQPQQPQQNNFQQGQQSNAGNFQQSQQANGGNFQQNQQANGGNFQQNQQANGGNFQQGQQGRQQNQANNFQGQQGNFQSRQTTAAFRGQSNNQQTFGAQQNRQTTPQQPPRQFFNRNGDDFEEGDNQEFLKTAPSNNFRPSDLNSFANNYNKGENGTRFAQTSTAKYYTPTIVTTPKTTTSYEAATTLRQSNFFSTQAPAASPARGTLSPSSTFAPQPSRLPQRIYPSPTPAKAGETKDASYDYAYYDDAGAFSEYDGIDGLGEGGDFSRTSQRAKARLI